MPKIGKGLKELLDEYEYSDNIKENIQDLDINLIKPNPYQPRYLFDEEKIEELAISIKEYGLLQPIVVKKMNGYYAIVAGERRYKACKSLGMKSIQSIVRMYEKEKMIQLALIENLQRQDLSPIEEANGYLRVMRELDLTQGEVAKKVGKSRSHVTNMLGLLNLPENILALVSSGKISMGHARVLSKLEDKDEVKRLAKAVSKSQMSVRELEGKAKASKRKNPLKSQINKEVTNIEKKFEKKYGTKVQINEKTRMIKFKSKEGFDKLIKKLLEEENV